MDNTIYTRIRDKKVLRKAMRLFRELPAQSTCRNNDEAMMDAICKLCKSMITEANRFYCSSLLMDWDPRRDLIRSIPSRPALIKGRDAQAISLPTGLVNAEGTNICKTALASPAAFCLKGFGCGAGTATLGLWITSTIIIMATATKAAAIPITR